MKKVAFIVDYSIRTRVVAEVPDDFNDETPFTEEMHYELARNGRENIMADPAGYLCGDNVYDITEDYECPYDPEGLDKEEEKEEAIMLLLSDGTVLTDETGHLKKFASEADAKEAQKNHPNSTIFIPA